MKKAILPLLFLPLFILSCTEIGPNINSTGTGGGDGVQNRRVLIEEFTGVRCVNCPEGSEKIEELLAIHGEDLIAVSIHSGFFADPYNDSNIDFRTSEGAAIEAMLGSAIGYPAATINRTLFDSETQTILGKDKWAGYIALDKLEAPKVNVDVSKTWNETSRQLGVTVGLQFNESVNEALGVSVMITEDDVTDVQLTPDGKDYEYKHKHALRGMMTNFDGRPYTGETQIASTGSETFSMTIPQEWDVNKCNIIAFVHMTGASKNVLQAAEINIVD